MINPRFVIKAVISGQRLNINIPLTVAGTVNYIGVEAKCTSEWDGCTVVCYIKNAAGNILQLAMTYDDEKDIYYFPTSQRLSLIAGEWSIWFVGIAVSDGQESYRIVTEEKTFTVANNELYSSVPQGDITLDEQAISMASNALVIANNLLNLYLNGEFTGPQGEPGDPAQIGFVQASVDNTTGTPRCTVTVSEDPDGVYNMQFDFTGIKGAKGDKGDTGAQGPQGLPGTNGTDGRTIDDYILVQDNEPTSETNKMWLKPTASEPALMYTAEELDAFSKAIDSSVINVVPTLTFEQGNINGNSGVPTSTTLYAKRLRSPDYIKNQHANYIIISVPENYYATIFKYSGYGSGYTGRVSINDSLYISGTVALNFTEDYFKILVRRIDNEDLTPSDLPYTNLITFVHQKGGYDIYPTNDDTDRSQEIVNILHNKGECRFADGDYYVSNLICDGAMSGSGINCTRLICKDSSATKHCIKMTSNSIIKNMTIEAYVEGGGDITPIADYTAGKYAIQIGSLTSTEDNTINTTIENVVIKNFTGCGVFCRKSTNSNGGSFVNVRAFYCSAGFYFGNGGEYNTMTNCYAKFCYTGLVMMGGNNIVDSCVFSANEVNINLKETDTYGTADNDGHGIINSCKLTHAGYYSNSYPGDGSTGGYDILGEAQASAEIISNCFIGYPIYIKDRLQPLQITSCQIRRNSSVCADHCRIAMFNCMFQNGDTVFSTPNNGVIIRKNCMDYTGTDMSN